MKAELPECPSRSYGDESIIGLTLPAPTASMNVGGSREGTIGNAVRRHGKDVGAMPRLPPQL
jgi:hypothetical protein